MSGVDGLLPQILSNINMKYNRVTIREINFCTVLNFVVSQLKYNITTTTPTYVAVMGQEIDAVLIECFVGTFP